jgi:TolB-like protein/DNA-binding winged helix-turn-helix (wHTH) protein/Flp pilus assembly protein TadD
MASRPGPNAKLIGEWIADPDDDSLTRGAESARIEPRMMRLLMRLARTPGEVVSQDALLDDVWQGVVVSPASVYQNVSQLRKALGDTETPPSYIETVARKGYRLVAPVTAAAVEAPAAEAPPVPLPDTSVHATPNYRRRGWLAALAAGVALVAAGILWWRPAASVAAPADSIVVLPIVDMTEKRTEQAFCDGMSEELSNWLAQIPSLRVVARTSAFAFRDRNIDVREIGRTLDTDYVLEGSMRRSGEFIRVTVQLIGTRDGFHKWSSTFEEPAGDLLLLQERIARAVATNLELRFALSGDQLEQRRDAKPEAQGAYILAQHHFQLRTRKDNDRAIELYRQALERDPKFTLAQIGLAYAYLNQYVFDGRAIDEIARDVEPLLADVGKRAPDLPELHAARGALLGDQGHYAAALTSLQKANQLNPNLFRAILDTGRLQLNAGKPREALLFYDKAVERDPLSAELRATRCFVLSDLGRFADAARDCDRARSLDADSYWARTASSLLEQARGRPRQALGYARLILRSNGDVAEAHFVRALQFMQLGMPREARASYESLMSVAGEAAPLDPEYARIGLQTAFGLGGAEAMRKQVRDQNLDATKDPRLLLALAEAELLAGDAAAARRYLDRALALPGADSELLADPRRARLGASWLLVAAAAEDATGAKSSASARLEELDKLLDRLAADGVRTHGLYELRANMAALRGDASAAREALQKSIGLGWRSTWTAEREPYFQSLRDDPAIAALFAEVDARNAADARLVLSEDSAS